MKGELFVQRDVAYVPQQSWILNDTIRRNIVFSSPYDPERYGRTVAACPLEADISQIDGGHDAEIVCSFDHFWISPTLVNDIVVSMGLFFYQVNTYCFP